MPTIARRGAPRSMTSDAPELPLGGVWLSARLRFLLRTGRLEQMCHSCGRWEAAGFCCSWCQRPMGPADWYPNGDLAERRTRLPATPPARPPCEYADASHWPAPWGPYPYRKPSREP